MTNRRTFSSLLIVLIFAASAQAADEAPKITPVSKPGAEWQQKHAANVASAKAGSLDVLFFGDSITEYWSVEGQSVWDKQIAPLKAANFGIAADKVENILWRVQNGELEGVKPKAVVLLGGINNTWGTKRDQHTERGLMIAEGLTQIVKTIRAKLPQTKVLVLAIFPVEDGSDLCVKVANEKLAKLDNQDTIRFLDIGPKLADANGKLIKESGKDGLHLSAKGYQIWADAMLPVLAEMMAAKK